MCLGLGIGLVEEEPYTSARQKRMFSPTVPSMLEEIQRRCTFLDLAKQPKPKNWKKPAMIAWLERFPIKNASCVSYIKTEELQLRNALVEARKEDEPATGPALAWRTDEPWLRLYHCLIEDIVKKAFVSRNQLMERLELDAGKNHPKRPKPWSVELAKKFNSSSFVVRTMPLPDLHHCFVESLTIKLEDCPGEITAEEVERRVAESQTTLKKIIMKWEISGRGDGEQNDDLFDEHDEPARLEGESGFGHIEYEKFDFRAGDNRSKFLYIEGKERKPHLLYFWHLMDSNEILDVALDIIELSVGGDSESAPVAGGLKPSTKAKREREKDKDTRRARRRRAKQSKLQESMNNSMQDLARSSRTEARIAAFEKVWTAKLQLANRILDSVAQAAGIERATTEYLAAIEQEIAAPAKESQSQHTTSSSDESEDNVD
jgi:hypothetical protein